MKFILIIATALIAISIINSVVITHIENDIRRTILSSFQDKPKKDMFKVYHFLYEKKYDLNTEEGIRRYRIFKNNLNFIEIENAKNNSFQLGITKFTDLTREEFKKTYLNSNMLDESQEMENFLEPQIQEIPEMIKQDDYTNKFSLNEKSLRDFQVDWTHVMNPAVEQGNCGSCWAFATVAAIEGNYNIKTGIKIKLSEQELVDCDTKSRGCDGGRVDTAIYYAEKKGLALRENYPYTSGMTQKQETCRASNTPRNMIVKDYTVCHRYICLRSKLYSMLEKGPIIVSIDADGGSESIGYFQNYVGGIIENMNCNGRNHSVVMIGKLNDSNGEYYIGRNSWGSGWGENGNFRIRTRGSNGTCFMEKYGILPIIN